MNTAPNGAASTPPMISPKTAVRWVVPMLSRKLMLAATLTTHAYARLDDNAVLMAVEALHQFGAAVWIGAIPSFVLVLRRIDDADGLRLVGARFSRLSMLGVACILLSGAVMCVFYVGDAQGFYGTAYGVMVSAKIAMFIALLGLGLGNLLVTERLRKVYPYIGHMQIGNPPGRNEPGQGELDLQYFFRAVEQLGWDRWIGCEYAPATTTLESIGWHTPFSTFQ